MIGLSMVGWIINHLTRSTIAVAAPTLLADLVHLSVEVHYERVDYFE
jgi:hypothetical protein